MPVFTYKAIDPGGARTSGTVSARSRPAALEQVARKGLVAVAMDQQREAEQTEFVLKLGGDRVPPTVAEAFHRELANLLTAGVPMIRSLGILQREASHRACQETVERHF